MKNNILYRAIATRTNHFVYGQAINIRYKWIMVNKYTAVDFMYSDRRGYDGIIIPTDVYEFIDEDTLCRFTQINDINGVPIFEGDALEMYDTRVKSVVYKSKVMQDSMVYFRSVEFPVIHLSQLPKYIKYRVIGNVFENPELIKELQYDV